MNDISKTNGGTRLPRQVCCAENRKLAHMFGRNLKETMVFALKKEDYPSQSEESASALGSRVFLQFVGLRWSGPECLNPGGKKDI